MRLKRLWSNKEERWKLKSSGRRGSAVVLLSILFVSLTGALAITYEAADRKAAIGVAEAAFNNAGRSVLACYDKDLFERYAVFAFEGDEEKTEKRLKKIVRTSIENTRVAGCRVNDVEAEQSAYAVSDPDNMMIQLREITKKYAAGTVIADVKSDLKNAGNRVKDKDRTRKKIKEAEKNQRTSEKAAAEASAAAEISGSESSGPPAEMDAEKARELQDGLRKRADGVKDEPENYDSNGRHLRNGKISESLPSVAEGCRGRSAYAGGTVLKDLSGGGSSGAKDDLVTVTYIDTFFRNNWDADSADKNFFRAEVEYILYGCMSDEENYKKTYRSIFVIRTAVNTAHLYSDTGKRELILATAEALTPGLFAPLTQLLITTAWAAVEADNDMKNLEAGNGVPLMKDDSTWMTDINGIVNGSSQAYIEIPGHSPMKYGRYLDMLLLTLDRDTKLYRIMDLMQINIKGSCREDFTMADHYTGFALKASVNKKSHAVGVVDSSADISMTHTYITEE